MENGIEESPDRSCSPTPFFGFSPQSEIKKEIRRVFESPTVRVSQPRTTKSRASLVWQKNGQKTIKEEPADEETQTKRPPSKKVSVTTVIHKQKPVKVMKSIEKETVKTVKVEKDTDVSTETVTEKRKMKSKTISLPSTSIENLKKRRRKLKAANKQGFKCNQCGRLYKYLRGMRQHQKLECNVEPQFPCPYCPTKFRYRQMIREHVRTRHEQAFPKWYATHYVIPMLKQDNFSPC